MTKPRSTSQIIATAKDALGLLTNPDWDAATKPRLVDMMVSIIETATRMDARPAPADPKKRKKPAKQLDLIPGE